MYRMHSLKENMGTWQVASLLLAVLIAGIHGFTTTAEPSGNCVTSCSDYQDGDYQSCKGCHVYVTCSHHAIFEDRPCPGELVWDDLTKKCELTSQTCTEPGDSDIPSGQDADHLAGVCPEGFSGLLPDPDHCARYYLCIQGAVEPRDDTRAQRECPYPSLFSSKLLDCTHYKDVTCGNRTEPKAPCDYFGPMKTLNLYQDSRRKRSPGRIGNPGPPCEVHLPPCLGLPNGPNSWIYRENSPYYVECRDERTMTTRLCSRGVAGEAKMFSETQRKCVSIWDFPREEGGRRPSCFGKPNGFYPDEESWCPFYYECENGEHEAFYKCPSGLNFSGLSGKCEPPEFVPSPCGGAGSPTCHDKDDGFHPDAAGRCPFFMLCLGGLTKGVFKCENAGQVFNPNTTKCDSPDNSPKPCGKL